MFRDKSPLHILYSLIIVIFIFLIFYLLIKLFPLYGAIFSFLWRLFAPFLISCLIAYLLYPVIEHLHDHFNIHKVIAILSIYLLFFGGIGYLIYRVYPIFIIQLRDLNEHLPQLISMYEHLIYKVYESTSFLPETVHDKIDDLIDTVETTLEDLLGKLVGGFTKIFDFIILLTVIPVLVFYFLKDEHIIRVFLKKLIPNKYNEQVSKLTHSIDKSLGNYIRGQLLICFLVGAFTFVVFYLLEIKYALLLAIIIGLTNVIPYFGPIIGAVPAVALTLTVSTKLVIFVIITILVIQLIESNLLQPYILGKSINIHPIAIIFALLLGAQLSGIWGMILAVPSLTIIKELAFHIYVFRQYR